MNITSKNYDGQDCVLVDKETQQEIELNQLRVTFRGEEAIVTGGKAPQSSNSTGRVYLKKAEEVGSTILGEFYPGVVGCEWIGTAVPNLAGE